MKKECPGLSPEERESLGAQPSIEPQLKIKFSLFVFANLLLICVLIVATSLIVRTQGIIDEVETGVSPSQTETETLSPLNEEQQEEVEEQKGTGEPVLAESEPAPMIETDPTGPGDSATHE